MLTQKYYILMGFTTWISVLLLLTVVHSITMAVNSQDDRCMVVFSSSEEDFLKVELKFSRFHEQSKQEGYRIKLRNSETHEEELFSVEEGTFRKEFQLTPNIAYYLCVKIILEHSRQGEIQEYIEYNSGVKHSHNIHEAPIAIPPNLLKTKDLQQSYQHLSELQHLTDSANVSSATRTQWDSSTFLAQNQQMQELQWLSLFELATVIALGSYQFIRLRAIISGSQEN